MNTKLYEKLHEKLHEEFDPLEDVFKPMSDEDEKTLHKYDASDEEKVIKRIKPINPIELSISVALN